MAQHVECYNGSHEHQSRGKPAKVRMLCAREDKCQKGGIIRMGELYTWTRGGDAHLLGELPGSSAPPPAVPPAPTVAPPSVHAPKLTHVSEALATVLLKALPPEDLIKMFAQFVGTNLAQH